MLGRSAFPAWRCGDRAAGVQTIVRFFLVQGSLVFRDEHRIIKLLMIISTSPFPCPVGNPSQLDIDYETVAISNLAVITSSRCRPTIETGRGICPDSLVPIGSHSPNMTPFYLS